jgi:hypothetical protein
MPILKLHKDIYTQKAIGRAAVAYRKFCVLSSKKNKDHFLVGITPRDIVEGTAPLVDEIGNFILAESLKNR